MASRGTRRELEDSVRLLVGEERPLFLGLAAGAVGYLIWLSGTGVAVDQFLEAALGPVSVDPWSTEADLLAATYLVLWVFAPSLLAVRLVVGELTNIRGNIEKRYRMDQPLVLLVVPLAAVLVVLVAGLATGFGFWTLLGLGAASVVLLVRTVAYGYRVYSLSFPRLLQGLVFVAAVVVSLAVASRTARLAGQEAFVRAAATRYGVHALTFGIVDLGPVSTPLLPFAGAVVPALLALAYVWFQIMASLVVRIRRPDVPRSEIRAGQRYPSVVQPGTSRRLAMGTAPDEDEESRRRRGHEADTAGTSDRRRTGGRDAGPHDGSSTAEGTADGGSVEDGTGTASDLAEDQFGDTRVYTPPDARDAEEQVDESTDVVDGDSVKSELCPICGATYEADTDRTHCPNCNAVLEQ